MSVEPDPAKSILRAEDVFAWHVDAVAVAVDIANERLETLICPFHGIDSGVNVTAAVGQGCALSLTRNS